MSDHHRHYDEDVESYRSRKRRQDREGRENPPPQKDSKQNYASEREERMARLRQEMQEEDMKVAAALDERIKKKEEELKPKPQETIIKVNEEELEGLDEDEQMRLLMGIEGFGTTKGKEVKDNKNSAARGVATKNKARKYRQYMNRKNGFNRPLEKMD